MCDGPVILHRKKKRATLDRPPPLPPTPDALKVINLDDYVALNSDDTEAALEAMGDYMRAERPTSFPSLEAESEACMFLQGSMGGLMSNPEEGCEPVHQSLLDHQSHSSQTITARQTMSFEDFRTARMELQPNVGEPDPGARTGSGTDAVIKINYPLVLRGATCTAPGCTKHATWLLPLTAVFLDRVGQVPSAWPALAEEVLALGCESEYHKFGVCETSGHAHYALPNAIDRKDGLQDASFFKQMWRIVQIYTVFAHANARDPALCRSFRAALQRICRFSFLHRQTMLRRESHAKYALQRFLEWDCCPIKTPAAEFYEMLSSGVQQLVDLLVDELVFRNRSTQELARFVEADPNFSKLSTSWTDNIVGTPCDDAYYVLVRKAHSCIEVCSYDPHTGRPSYRRAPCDTDGYPEIRVAREYADFFDARKARLYLERCITEESHKSYRFEGPDPMQIPSRLRRLGFRRDIEKSSRERHDFDATACGPTSRFSVEEPSSSAKKTRSIAQARSKVATAWRFGESEDKETTVHKRWADAYSEGFLYIRRPSVPVLFDPTREDPTAANWPKAKKDERASFALDASSVVFVSEPAQYVKSSPPRTAAQAGLDEPQALGAGVAQQRKVRESLLSPNPSGEVRAVGMSAKTTSEVTDAIAANSAHCDLNAFRRQHAYYQKLLDLPAPTMVAAGADADAYNNNNNPLAPRLREALETLGVLQRDRWDFVAHYTDILQVVSVLNEARAQKTETLSGFEGFEGTMDFFDVTWQLVNVAATPQPKSLQRVAALRITPLDPSEPRSDALQQHIYLSGEYRAARTRSSSPSSSPLSSSLSSSHRTIGQSYYAGHDAPRGDSHTAKTEAEAERSGDEEDDNEDKSDEKHDQKIDTLHETTETSNNKLDAMLQRLVDRVVQARLERELTDDAAWNERRRREEEAPLLAALAKVERFDVESDESLKTVYQRASAIWSLAFPRDRLRSLHGGGVTEGISCPEDLSLRLSRGGGGGTGGPGGPGGPGGTGVDGNGNNNNKGKSKGKGKSPCKQQQRKKPSGQAVG